MSDLTQFYFGDTLACEYVTRMADVLHLSDNESLMLGCAFTKWLAAQDDSQQVTGTVLIECLEHAARLFGGTRHSTRLFDAAAWVRKMERDASQLQPLPISKVFSGGGPDR